MKIFLRFFLVLLLTGLGLSTFAQFTVVVFAPKGEKFTLYISGVSQNSKPASRVETNNPGGPSFKMKVTFADASIPEISKFVFNKPGSTMYYKIGTNQKGAYVLESTTSEWMDDGVVKENVTPTTPPAENKSNTEKEKSKNEPEKSPKSKVCDNPMSEPDFNAQLVGISARPFDPIKLSAAKKMAETHCLLVSQVKMVMYVFDSESSRLSFAKYAYDYTYNKGEYSEVNDALHSEKSKDDLNKYVTAHK